MGGALFLPPRGARARRVVIRRALSACRAALIVLLATLSAAPVVAAETLVDARTFVAEAFPGVQAETGMLWLTPEIRAEAARVLGREPAVLRQRYWKHGARTAWILEEIGKEEPITAGFVVEDGRLVGARLLIYRESRGWEIRYPYFLDQFADARLDEALQLDRPIDGISGATLSVRAMQTMARLALLYHARSTKGG